MLESVLEEFDITGKTEWKGCERCGVWFCPFCSISGHESKCKERNNGKEKIDLKINVDEHFIILKCTN